MLIDSTQSGPDPSAAFDTTLEAAITYTKLDWFVLPLHGVHDDGACRCRSGQRCTSAGKHPLGALAPHGFRDASRYRPTVERWFRVRPMANLGIITGPSGLASLDVDPRNGGDESFELLMERHGPTPITLRLLTGGGGFHLIFSDPKRSVRKHSPAAGIDVLGGGSLFVAPPSRHRSGRLYRWEDWSVPLAPAPEWLAGQ